MVEKDLQGTEEEIYQTSKNYLLQAKNILSNLEKTPPSQRNTHFMKNEDLKTLQMSIVMNSLLITKVKMQEGGKAKINFEKTQLNLPIIEIEWDYNI